MKSRPTSRDFRVGATPRLHVHGLLGAALAVAVFGCSSEDKPTSLQPPAPTPEGLAPDPAGDTPTSEAAADPNEAAPEGEQPAASASEAPQVTDLAPPEEDTTSGESSPNTPDPGEEMTGSEPEPVPEGTVPEAAVPSAGCGKTRTLQNGNQTIASGGMNRTYFLETPSDYDSTYPYRVIFMFHWNFGSINAIVNPPDADRNTDRPFYGMGDLTDGKTIFVVPQGLVGSTGGAGWDNPNNRDVNFTDAMLDAISSDLCIDTSRVFTTGFSFGAGMSMALACVRPDKFRAAVVYEPGFVSELDRSECTTAIPFFQSHGVDDQILNYANGLNVLSMFSRINGCTPMTPADPPQNGHTCISMQGCSVPTRFCNFGAGENSPVVDPLLRGHYPSPKDPGQSTSWVPAEAWSFITQF
jgi:hypothetical protein